MKSVIKSSLLLVIVSAVSLSASDNQPKVPFSTASDLVQKASIIASPRTFTTIGVTATTLGFWPVSVPVIIGGVLLGKMVHDDLKSKQSKNN